MILFRVFVFDICNGLFYQIYKKKCILTSKQYFMNIKTLFNFII